jgi:hypothetical protein
VAGEVLSYILLHKLDTKIRVADALDFVANTRNYRISSIHG